MFWVRAESLLTHSQYKPEHVPKGPRKRLLTRKHSVHGTRREAFLTANGTELVGICVKLACTEEPRCYSPEGNLQGNKLSILERHHVFPRGCTLARFQLPGWLMTCANSVSGSLTAA